MSVAALSKLDLNAYALARSWGVDLTPTVTLKPVSPCGRSHCGGSVLGSGCLLCARPGGRNNAADIERELERETGLVGLARAVLGEPA